MEQIEIVKEQLRAYEENRRYALATILETDGNTTRTSGKMLVYESGAVCGTVGGGALEQMVLRDALELLRGGRAGGLQSYDLNSPAAEAGLSCGGAMRVFFEVYDCRPTLVMCGAGHVGAAVMTLARFLGFQVLLLDSRPRESISGAVALADRFVPVADFRAGIQALEVPPGAFFVIAGPNHASDGAALAGALTKSAAYVGMIGGPKKISAIFAQLRDSGVPQEALDAVFTPIGLDLGGERPEEIALSILAQVLMVRNGKAPSRP